MYRQSVFKTYSIFLAVAVVFALPAAELLHAVIPHNHGGVLAGNFETQTSERFLSFAYMSANQSFDVELGRLVAAADVPAQKNSDIPGKGTSDLWDFIHFSLRHEQKKVFLVFGAMLLVVQALLFHTQKRFTLFIPLERTGQSQYERSLSRGILAHRAFG